MWAILLEEDFTAQPLIALHRFSVKGYALEGGGRINTFFVPFAPWDERSKTVLRFRKIEQTDLVYIYLTYESISKFSPRVSADGHILIQQTIPFDSFDAVWFYDWKDEEYCRLMITKGYEQIVLSVQGAKKIATIERFDKLIGNVVPDESSPDLNEHQLFEQTFPWTQGLE